MSKRIVVRPTPPILTATLLGTSSQTSSPQTSSTFGGGTVHWITSTTEVRELSVDPPSQVVRAGETAVFEISTSLDSPKFRLEGLPTGFRYAISRGEGAYYLKVMTHPLSYGTFQMELEVTSGNAIERASISLTVKKAETSSATTHPQSEGTTSTSTHSVEPTPTEEMTGTSLTGRTTHIETTQPTVTVTTVVVKGGDSVLPVALGTMAAFLTLLVILLVKRRG